MQNQQVSNLNQEITKEKTTHEFLYDFQLDPSKHAIFRNISNTKDVLNDLRKKVIELENDQWKFEHVRYIL